MTTDEAEELAAVRNAAERIAADRPESDAALDWDRTTWERLDEAGLTRIAVPERLGGGGGTLRAAAEVLRVAGAHALRVPLAETMLAGWLLEQAGIELPDGVSTVALGPGPRRIPYGRVADRVVLLEPVPDGAQVGVHQLPAERLRPGATLAGDPLDDLPEDLDPSGLLSAGLAPALADAYDARVALTRLILASGAASTVQEMTVRHVRERVQFGRPVAAFQAVQQQLAELAGEVAALQIGADAALLATESDDPAAWMRIATAKCDADRSVHRLTTIAHQLHGAIGATSEHALRRFTLRLWSWREEGGSGRQWAERIADRVVGPGGSARGHEEGMSLWAHVVGE